MRSLASFTLLLCTVPLRAQSSPPPQTDASVAPVWDVRNVIEDLAKHSERMLAVFDQIDPKTWSERGASETYAAQLQSCKEQTKAVVQGARQLVHNPEKLSAGLDLYIRMAALDNMTHSLEEGIRKYQNPAVAELLASVAGTGNRNREQFQGYLVELATEREKQFSVMDQEAQRCRGILARQPIEFPQKSGRKK